MEKFQGYFQNKYINVNRMYSSSLINFSQSQHKKQYRAKHEDTLRMNKFMQNVNYIRRHNKLHKSGNETYEMGINKYTDLMDTERSHLTGFVMEQSNITLESYGSEIILTQAAAPASLNWVEKGYVTSVKDQGICGR